MPTEDDLLSDHFHQMGREYGATTGRARRCGWLDAILTRHARIVNGINEFAVTNLDGLDTLSTIRVCTGYRLGKKTIDRIPNAMGQLAQCRPVYTEFPGWEQSTEKCRKWSDLPLNARRYLRAIAELSGAKLRIVSVGPARAQTIEL